MKIEGTKCYFTIYYYHLFNFFGRNYLVQLRYDTLVASIRLS